MKKLHWGWKTLFSAFSAALVLGLGMMFSSIVSYAQSAGEVTGESVYIRKEPDAGSEAVASVKQGDSVAVNKQTTGADGELWYQVLHGAEEQGYIRANLVTITDGTTPPTEVAATFHADTANPGDDGSSAQVSAVNPVSATVSGGKTTNVNVRANASTNSKSVTKVPGGTAITVTGQATASDGKLWYQVSFNFNGSDVEGFIRSDYVKLSGELTPATDPGDAETPQPDAPEPSAEEKAWETQQVDGAWMLIRTETQGSYNIEDLISAMETNAKLYKEEQATTEKLTKSNKSQKIVIILLVILLVAAAAAAVLFFLKMKDMMDDAAFSQVERDTIRRRGSDRRQEGTRPAGGRPAGQGAARPAGTRPASGQGGARPAGTRPAPGQGGPRPAGTRPTPGQGAARPAGTRPASGQGGPRPTGARPAGTRPAETRPSGQNGDRPGERIRREAEAPQRTQNSQNGQGKAPGWKSKNFMSDEDDFEFKFLDMDGEEDK